MKFSNFAKYLNELESTSSRLAITKILSNLFKESDKSEIDKVVYLSLGILAPSYEGIVLNLAEKMVVRAISKAFNTPEDEVKKQYGKSGDLGDVSSSLSSNNSNSQISVSEVYEKLFDIAKDGGEGSQDRKIEKMAQLLSSLDSESSKFVARIPTGRLRLGFSEKTILDALNVSEKYYNIHPDIGYIAKLAKEDKLESVSPEIGIPVVPMLAQRLNSPSEMIKKMGEVAVEPKFDGLRIFIHYRKKDNFIRIFTRNMNAIDIETFPELKEVGKYIKADEIILDTEAIGIDPERESFLDFQKTIQRRRKHDVTQNAKDVPLQFQVFDAIKIDGRSLINEPYVVRRKVVSDVITSGSLLRVDESTITKEPEVIRDLHTKYLKMGLEGVVVKKTTGNYISGRTGWNWVKMKEVEGQDGKLSDTLDLVVMGYSLGKGKRAGFGVGQFLAGIKDNEKIKTVTKVGTGLTDSQFIELNKRLKKITQSVKPKEYEVHKDLEPDYWVRPLVVVEIAADEITVSPKHTAGFALRFPRLIKFRDDKSIKDVTTLKELIDLKHLFVKR